MASSQPPPESSPSPPPFIPTSTDIRTMRSILQSLGLPLELTLPILDHAHYWTLHTTTKHQELRIRDHSGARFHTHAAPYLLVPISLAPTPHGETPLIREIAFTTLSHDHVWWDDAARGTYRSSSWFEVSIMRGVKAAAPAPTELLECRFRDIERVKDIGLSGIKYVLVPRPDSALEPQRLDYPEMMRVGDATTEGTHAWWLQGNKVGAPNPMALRRAFREEDGLEHRVVWGCGAEPGEGAGRGEGFIECLRDGDWIVLWARTKRPRCENYVYKASVEIRCTI